MEGIGSTNTHFDRLYNRVEFTENDLRLYQTPQLSRLRQVSLSAVPTWTIPTSTCATRFEHSIGVGHLAKIIGLNPKFKDVALDLYFAALGHDLGTPPFSHLSEGFQIKLLGLNHEQFIDTVIEGSEFAKEVKKQGGNIERIMKIIKGEEKPISDIVNGTIDIDNLDNSLRYGLSIGLFPDPLYNPEILAESYDLNEGLVVLNRVSSADLLGWEKCRKSVYDYIYSSNNTASGSMIWRALYLAFKEGEITPEYFSMNDYQAYQFLEERCNERTSLLMKYAKMWVRYPQVFNLAIPMPTESLNTLIADSWNRGIVADELSSFLKTDVSNICVHFGKSRSLKRIHLPILDANGNKREHIPQNNPSWIAQVYVNPHITDRIGDINDFMRYKLGLN